MILNVNAVSCGDNITTDTTLTSDLVCDGTGIIVGAANVTLDCNGYKIQYNLSNQQLYGVYIETNDFVTVKNCIISEYEYGIRSFDEYEVGQHSDNDSVINNTIINTKWGIVHSGSDTILSNNTIINSTGGISLYGTRDTLTGNTLDNASILVEGEVSTRNSHYIDTTNEVNGKPVYYITDVSNYFAPIGGGQLIIANSTNVTIENQSISGILYGIYLSISHNCTIQNNNLTQNTYSLYLKESDNNKIRYNNVNNNTENGIYLSLSNNNLITSNIARYNAVGIYFNDVNYTDITNNTATNNTNSGIYLVRSRNNYVYENTLVNNRHGIALSSSSINNTLENNTISNNTKWSEPLFVDNKLSYIGV